MSLSITIQNLDEATAAWISEEAKRRGVTAEEMTVELIHKGINMEQKSSLSQIYHDLDSLAGTWSDEETTEFLNAVSHFNQVDEKLWL